MLAEQTSRVVSEKRITNHWTMKDMESVLKQFLCFKPKFKMKTSSRNISKLRIALQNMYSAERLQMAASSIAIISIISNGYP